MNENTVIEMYDKGKSTYDIAKELKTYPNKIRRILMKHGVELKNKSEAQKNALKHGKSTLPTEGRKRSEAEKVKISSGLKKMWQDMSEETYNEYVERARDRWHTMDANEKRKMSEAAIKAIQIAGKEGSKLEKFLFAELTKGGHVVEFHKKNLIANRNLEIDMYVPAFKAIIEIDGPSHFFPIWGEEKLRKQIKADSEKTGLILSKGFVIIRVKSLSSKVSLASKAKLKTSILQILGDIEKSFPDKEKRYIEVEI